MPPVRFRHPPSVLTSTWRVKSVVGTGPPSALYADKCLAAHPPLLCSTPMAGVTRWKQRIPSFPPTSQVAPVSDERRHRQQPHDASKGHGHWVPSRCGGATTGTVSGALFFRWWRPTQRPRHNPRQMRERSRRRSNPGHLLSRIQSRRCRPSSGSFCCSYFCYLSTCSALLCLAACISTVFKCTSLSIYSNWSVVRLMGAAALRAVFLSWQSRDEPWPILTWTETRNRPLSRAWL